eukprot:COSAG02_NODE_8239_length_2645_cov_11.536135_1_plen_80_part_00
MYPTCTAVPYYCSTLFEYQYCTEYCSTVLSTALLLYCSTALLLYCSTALVMSANWTQITVYDSCMEVGEQQSRRMGIQQ